MALKIYTAADQLLLAEKLAGVEQENGHLFSKHFVVTGHNSTNDFLIQELAVKNGIAANIAFQRPSELVRMVYAMLEAGPKFKDQLNGAQLVWVIDNILADDIFLSQIEFVKIKDYIETDTQKRFALAEKISTLFSSYQEENPAIIENWNQGNNYDKLEEDLKEDEIWQRKIWLKLQEVLADQLPDLTKVFSAIKTALEDVEKQKRLSEKLPFISFFGNLPYTKEYIDFIQLLSNFCRVSIFQIVFENDGQNRLVQNFGKLAQSQSELFDSMPNERIIENSSSPRSLLGALQQEIKGFKANWQVIDDSITIANNFKISREVEAFYNYLVHQFEVNPSLKMRDICVITPAIEQYAPAIQAFFANKNFEIDFTFYDSSHKIHASPYAALEALLQMEADQFTSKKVMSLLEFDYIREKFGFSEDLSTLHRAVNLANIRHAIEGDETIETTYVSWRYGLKRLIFGFCLPPFQEEVTFSGSTFFPVDEFEETATLEIIRLHQFVETLHEWLLKREESKTLREWVSFIENDTIELFIDFKELESNALRSVLGDLLEVANFSSPTITFKTMRYFMLNALGQFDGGERKGRGGVRFVGPNPYLSSPVKIYAFLGMNGKDFPRQEHRLSFDLRGKNGITKADLDKNLFLNILLSTKEKIYLSYIGQSIKDNSSIPPSTLIDELIDNLKAIVPTLDAKAFIVKHPLHAFSSKYNRAENAQLIQYQNTQQKELLTTQLLDKKAKQEPEELPVENGKKVILLKELIRFIEDPVRHYFNNVLGLYFGENSNELAETELFELDWIQKWVVKDEIAQTVLNHEPMEGLLEKLKMKGELPLSNFGSALFDKAQEELQEVLSNEEFQQLIVTHTRSDIKGEISVGNYVIKGSVDGIYGNTLLFQTVSKNKAKYQIRAMLNFFFAHLHSPKINHLLYVNIENFRSIEVADAYSEMEICCDLFEKGSKGLIAYSPEFEEINFSACSQSMDVEFPGEINDLINKELESDYPSGNPSDYFRKIAENNGFADREKATSFLDMYEKINELVSPIK
ncbi:MAG: exonuclease V subunit gamma [Flavobacteriales bacterium]|nr:exonuclease V subunit gamma [Flavobacteriales bacterium]